MRLALAQLNPLVGDLESNGRMILAACLQAEAQQADLVLTPELSLWGYPPRDLLLRPSFVQQQQLQLQWLAEQLPHGLSLLVGVAEPISRREVPRLHNALVLVEAGAWRVVCRKQLLPSYDVFDEQRYFRPGNQAAVLDLQRHGRQWRLGLSICEDLWVEEDLQGHRLAGADPIGALQSQGVDLLLNLSASPYGRGKQELRQILAARAAKRLGCPVAYVNQVGGNDELVFDGNSFVVDQGGAVLLRLACAKPDLVCWSTATSNPLPAAVALDHYEQLFRVLSLGIKDYARKCGFRRLLLGLSGGIDSALVAVLATAALGADQVEALMMPSPYSSATSLSDASALAKRLGIAVQTVPISPLMDAFDLSLEAPLGAVPMAITRENLQSRIRGSLLMAVANHSGCLLLSTGNKSELAVGYCTLYGDMNGGLAVIGDLYKTTVFGLCDWLDSAAAMPARLALGLPGEGELIGTAIRAKPPSAELRPDQQDSDSLPDYSLLDPLLKDFIEELASPEQLLAGGAEPELVQQVYSMLRRAEFKRRQTAPVLKVSGRAFGSGWRMPIAAA